MRYSGIQTPIHVRLPSLSNSKNQSRHIKNTSEYIWPRIVEKASSMSRTPIGARKTKNFRAADLLFRHSKVKAAIHKANKYFTAKIPGAPNQLEKK